MFSLPPHYTTLISRAACAIDYFAKDEAVLDLLHYLLDEPADNTTVHHSHFDFTFTTSKYKISFIA